MTLSRIEIDFDIHKLIETERRSFDEPPYVALRRLLGLPDLEPSVENLKVSSLDDGQPWSDSGVEVPHGSLARMKYNYGRELYEGQFLDGLLVVNGQKFRSLSTAASELAGKSLNGWLYWEAQFPGTRIWRRLGDLRDRARK